MWHLPAGFAVRNACRPVPLESPINQTRSDRIGSVSRAAVTKGVDELSSAPAVVCGPLSQWRWRTPQMWHWTETIYHGTMHTPSGPRAALMVPSLVRNAASSSPFGLGQLQTDGRTDGRSNRPTNEVATFSSDRNAALQTWENRAQPKPSCSQRVSL